MLKMCSWQQVPVQSLERQNFRIDLEYKTVFENSSSGIENLLLFGIPIFLLVIRGPFVVTQLKELHGQFSFNESIYIVNAKWMELHENSTPESVLRAENVGNISVYFGGSRVSLDCRVRAVPVPLLEFSCKKIEERSEMRPINCSQDLNATISQHVFST